VVGGFTILHSPSGFGRTHTGRLFCTWVPLILRFPQQRRRAHLPHNRRTAPRRQTPHSGALYRRTPDVGVAFSPHLFRTYHPPPHPALLRARRGQERRVGRHRNTSPDPTDRLRWPRNKRRRVATAHSPSIPLNLNAKNARAPENRTAYRKRYTTSPHFRWRATPDAPAATQTPRYAANAGAEHCLADTLDSLCWAPPGSTKSISRHPWDRQASTSLQAAFTSSLTFRDNQQLGQTSATYHSCLLCLTFLNIVVAATYLLTQDVNSWDDGCSILTQHQLDCASTAHCTGSHTWFLHLRPPAPCLPHTQSLTFNCCLHLRLPSPKHRGGTGPRFRTNATPPPGPLRQHGTPLGRTGLHAGRLPAA